MSKNAFRVRVVLKVLAERMQALKVPQLLRLLGEVHEEGAKFGLTEIRLNREGIFLEVVPPNDVTMAQVEAIQQEVERKLEAGVRRLLDEQNRPSEPEKFVDVDAPKLPAYEP